MKLTAINVFQQNTNVESISEKSFEFQSNSWKCMQKYPLHICRITMFFPSQCSAK